MHNVAGGGEFQIYRHILKMRQFQFIHFAKLQKLY